MLKSTLHLSTLIPNEKQKTSDYECTHQMGLFDTHIVQFGQVLLISGLTPVSYKYPIRIPGQKTTARITNVARKHRTIVPRKFHGSTVALQ